MFCGSQKQLLSEFPSQLIMNSIKFISRCGRQEWKERLIFSRYLFHCLKSHFFCTFTSNKCQQLFEQDDFFKKVIYNEVFQTEHSTVTKSEQCDSICLKYLNQQNTQANKVQTNDVETEYLHLPYQVKYQNDEKHDAVELFSESVRTFTPSDYEKINVPQWTLETYQMAFHDIENPIKWLPKDTEGLKNNDLEDFIKFGSCNLNTPVSSIPCGGCGALLHCNDPTLPGFIPAELFESKTKNELRGEKCQRCHFLKEFNVALGLNVSALEYKNLISSIKEKEALVIIMIDILDFPCSVFHGIFDLIGLSKQVVIVANKVDLLIQEQQFCEKYLKKSLLWTLTKQKINLEHVKHVSLISAKTGYGVEKLIDLLHSNWGNKGDIYLVGCTNVGKSSLFNTLIQSDFCKVEVIDLLQRATVSAWPGTTLNLLKFPIRKPSEWQLRLRSQRLSDRVMEESALKKFKYLGQNIKLEQIPLQEFVGRTFGTKKNPVNLSQSDDSSNDVKRKGINPDSYSFAKDHWFYDTPGVVHEDQIINLLTASELLLTVPKRMILPRNFQLQKGSSLFIAGLARLDFISGPDFVWFTVYASMELPITVTKTEDAECVYQKLLGTPYFRVPINGKERLAKWPNLLSKKFEIEGKLIKTVPKYYNSKAKKLIKSADVDIVLSSAGWVSVTVPSSYRCKVEAWTPQGKGIHLRDLPLIRMGHTFRGPKIPGTPAFRTVMKEVAGYSVNDTPSF